MSMIHWSDGEKIKQLEDRLLFHKIQVIRFENKIKKLETKLHNLKVKVE